MLWESARPGFGSTASWLCDIRQISPPLCVLDPSPVGIRVKREWLVEVIPHTGRTREGFMAGTLGPREGNGASGDMKQSSLEPCCVVLSTLALGQRGRDGFAGVCSPRVKK